MSIQSSTARTAPSTSRENAVALSGLFIGYHEKPGPSAIGARSEATTGSRGKNGTIPARSASFAPRPCRRTRSGRSGAMGSDQMTDSGSMAVDGSTAQFVVDPLLLSLQVARRRLSARLYAAACR